MRQSLKEKKVLAVESRIGHLSFREAQSAAMGDASAVSAQPASAERPLQPVGRPDRS